MRLLNGFRDSLSFIAFRWSSIRSARVKFLIFFAGLFGLTAMYIITQTGSLLINAASGTTPNTNPQLQEYALVYLNTFQNNEIYVFVAGILAASLIMILVTPFSVYSLGGIIPARDLATVSANENYKMSDSIIVQAMSSLSILQLFSLTVLGSLLTIEGGTSLGIFFSWGVWLTIVFFTNAFMWGIEWVNRKFGFRTKVGIVLSVVAVIVTAVIIDPYHGTTFFGLSPLYVDVVKNIGTTYNFSQVLSAFGFLTALTVLFAGLINFIAPNTLTLQEPTILKKDVKNRRNILSIGNKISFGNMISLLVFRYKVIWRPILITNIMASAFVLFLGGEGNLILGSFLIVTPLIVGMSFGVNIFGILGTSNIWLLSQPEWRKTALYKMLGVQTLVIGLSYLILFIPAIIAQKFSFGEILQAVPAMLVITVLMSMFGIYKSLKRPIKYVPSQRGDSILPPTTMLNYMFQLLTLGALIGGTVYAISNPLQQWGVALGFLLIGVLWFAVINKRWNDKEKYINNIIQVTTGD